MLKKLTVFFAAAMIGLGASQVQSLANISIIGKGPAPGTLIHPSGITLHKTSLWVCDAQQSRIFEYDIKTLKLVSARGSGNQEILSTIEPQGLCFDEKSQCYVLCKDILYSFNDQFILTKKLPIPGLLTDILYKDGKLWVCHYSQNQIIQIDAKSLKIINQFTVGKGPVSFAWNSSNELLVSETGESRISFYDEKGKKTRQPMTVDKASIISSVRIGLNDWIYLMDTAYYKVYAYSKGGGSKLRDFNIPGETVRCWKPGISGFIIQDSEVWVASPVQREVMVYSEDGQLKREYGVQAKEEELVFPASMVISQNSLHVADSYAGTVKQYDWKGNYLSIFGNKRGLGRLDFPVGIAQDEENNLFVLNAHSAVYQFDPNGKYVKEISGKYTFACATDLDYYQDHLYITDKGNQRILQVSRIGEVVKEWKEIGTPLALTINQQGQFFVLDAFTNRISWFDASGQLIQTLQDSRLKRPSALYAYNNQLLLISDATQNNISLWVYQNGTFQYANTYGEAGGPNTESFSNPPSALNFTVDAGKFMQPANIEFDGNFFYVMDQKNQRIQRIAKGIILDLATLPEEDKLVVEPEKLDFGRVKAGDSAIKKLSLRSSGSTKIEGKITTSQDWIRLGKLTFSGDSEVNVNVDTTQLTAGEHNGNVVVESNLGSVPVLVTIFIEGNNDEPPPPPEKKLISIVLVINQPKALVNDKEYWIDSANHKIAPVILPPGRTFVPIRFISEAFGAEVSWDSETQSVRIYLPAKEVRITLQINNKIAKLNNDVVTLDAPPTILQSRTFVPLRFIAEAFGAQILWDGGKQQITIELEV